MDKNELKGKLKEQKGKLKKKFTTLTDDDFMFEEGKEKELYSKRQIKLAKNQKRIAHQY